MAAKTVRVESVMNALKRLPVYTLKSDFNPFTSWEALLRSEVIGVVRRVAARGKKRKARK